MPSHSNDAPQPATVPSAEDRAQELHNKIKAT